MCTAQLASAVGFSQST